MFGKFPEVFNQNFAVGYFLPMVVFIIISIVLLNNFGILPPTLTIDTTNETDVLVKTALVGLVAWFGGIFLLAINRELFLFLEGYGRFNPLRLNGFLEVNRYKKLKKELHKLDVAFSEFDAKGQDLPVQLRLKRNRLMLAFVERFPTAEFGLLPTSFGNTVWAFQVYPRVMYGLDPIPGWNRLLTIIPKEYIGFVNDAKSQVDFWVNLCFLAGIVLIEYLIFIFSAGRVSILWLPIISIISILFAYSRAQKSAIEWGGLVKSSYDIFLPDLREKLQFQKSLSVRDEILIWQRFSQSIIYLTPESMPDRSPQNDKNDDKRKKSRVG
jgi:hypothetical protein